MTRPDKVAAVSFIRERMQSSSATVLTEYRGLTVAEFARLRAELRQTDAEYKVVKNTLTRIAARDAGLEVPDDLLTGPTAVTFCAGDPIGVAKVLRRFSRENPELIIKGAILDGRLLGAEDTLRLADLASREELLARVAGLLESVVAQPARLALASLSRAARLFAALAEKRVAQGESTEAPGTTGAPPSDASVPESAGPDDSPQPSEAQQAPDPDPVTAAEAVADAPQAIQSAPDASPEPAFAADAPPAAAEPVPTVTIVAPLDVVPFSIKTDALAVAPRAAAEAMVPAGDPLSAESATAGSALPAGPPEPIESAADAPLTVDPAFEQPTASAAPGLSPAASPEVDAPEADAPGVDAPEVDAPGADAPEADAPEVDAERAPNASAEAALAAAATALRPEADAADAIEALAALDVAEAALPPAEPSVPASLDVPPAD